MSHNAEGSPTAWKRQKFGETVYEGDLSYRPPGLEVADWSSVCAPCRPKELKPILTRKSQVFAHISGSPETLVAEAPGPRRSQFSW